LRNRIALLIATGSIAAVPTMAVSASGASGTVAHAACTQARIDGASKCIARGQFCKRSADRQYRKYGLKCTKRDANGRYHLQ
jgi:hypothetical protein